VFCALRLCEFFNLVLVTQCNSVVYVALELDHRANIFEIFRTKMDVCTKGAVYNIQARLVI
jgi:hypothetical protein